MSMSEIALRLAEVLTSTGVSSILGLLLGGKISDLTNYDKIRDIVGEELDADAISEIDSQTKALITWMQITYKNQKDAGAPKQQLIALLAIREIEVQGDLLGKLTAEGRQKGGLGVYLVLAGVHLALLQEMARIDPNGGGGYAKSVQDYATSYAGYAEGMFNQVVVEALGNPPKVKKAREQTCYDQGSPFESPICKTDDVEYYEWKPPKGKTERTLTYRPGSVNSNAIINEIYAKYNAFKIETKAELRSTFGKPREVASEWRKLVDRPVP